MIPIKKGIETTGQPAVSIESGDSSIPRKPILVEGGPAPEPVIVSLAATENGEYNVETGIDGFNPVLVNVEPKLTGLSVTENGTYRPEEPNEGFSAVVVNVDKSKPDYVELVDFDFKNSSLLDKIRNWTLPAQSYNQIQTTNDGIIFNGTNANCNIGFNPAANSFYEIKIKFGTNSSSASLNAYNALLKLNRTDGHQTLTYCRDVQIESNPMGTWRLNDESGNLQYLTVGYGDSHYFDNKELVIEYGYYYENGTFKLNLNRFSYKINDVYIYIGTSIFFINNSGNPQLVLGGGASLVGTVIETVKVKQLFKWNLDRSLFRKFEDDNLEIEKKEVK